MSTLLKTSQPGETFEGRYQIVSQQFIGIYPYNSIELLDTQTQHKFRKSAWEIICDDNLLPGIEKKHIAMLCASAVDERVKYESMLRSKIKSFAIQPVSTD